MNTENEIKLLGIHEDAVRSFLKQNNIECEATLEFKRVIFDTIPADKDAWIRLRTDGNETTLTYKKSTSDTIDGMQEIEVVTDSFDNTKQLLSSAGLTPRNYQENRREVYHAFGCMITIDFWPLIDPYVEIEAETKEEVEACLSKFEGLYESATSNSTQTLYEAKGIDLRSIDSLTF